MSTDEIIVALLAAGWEFSLSHHDELFSLWVTKPEWVTDNLYAARICPEGNGRTVEEAYKALQTALHNTQREG